MSEWMDPSPLAGFQGKTRLFPLPNLVFFPHVMQPLHIFEPRYRQMTEDALEGDRLITMVLPLPGWEKKYANKPAIHQVGCIGKIMAEQRLEDGRFNLLLRGLARVRLGQEILSEKLYRIADAEVLEETPFDDDDTAAQWRGSLIEKTPKWFAGQEEIIEQFRKLLASDLALGPICDILGFALPLDVEFKQTLLEDLDVKARLAMLCYFMDAKQSLKAALHRKFPPEFSVN